MTAGDPEAFAAARRAKLMVVTSRSLAELAASGITPDVLVGSARDQAEAFDSGALAEPHDVVRPDGRARGRDVGARRRERPMEEPVVRSRTTIRTRRPTRTAPATVSRRRWRTRLAAGMEIPAAIKLAARAGSATAYGRGPYTSQLTKADIDTP